MFNENTFKFCLINFIKKYVMRVLQLILLIVRYTNRNNKTRFYKIVFFLRIIKDRKEKL